MKRTLQMTKNNKFEYVYVAPSEAERKEILSIKQNYEPKKVKADTKLERLRKLDGKVNNTAMACSISLGIVGLLIFGTGLTMILEWNILAFGILVSLIGILPMALAYPIHNLLLKIGKKKYGAEIIKLSTELLEIKSGK